MKDEYILKHCDTDVAIFKIDNYTNNIDTLKILNVDFSPVNSLGSDVSQVVSFNSWLNNRCIPNSRDGIERLKKKYNLNDMKQIMIALYGLSLSDHYWIDKPPYNNKWKKVNLFENRYSEVLGNILFDKKLKIVDDINVYGYRNPNVTTGGNLRKYWKYNEKENKSYLIKGGSYPDYQEPFNEYFAHLLLNELKYKHTPYNIENTGNEWVSVCPCIADIDKEMISALDIVLKYGIEKSYKGLLDICDKKAMVGYKDDLNKMIVLDYLIDNIDRHWNNFGIVRDSSTGAWLEFIPIFDNGYSLWNKDFVDNKIISESMSFADSNEECIKLVDINKYIKILPDMVSVFDTAFEKYENNNRKEQIRNGIQEKMKDINMYMNNN